MIVYKIDFITAEINTTSQSPMNDPRIDIIRRLARRANNPALIRTIHKSRPEDIAKAFNLLPLASQIAIWDSLEAEEKAA